MLPIKKDEVKKKVHPICIKKYKIKKYHLKPEIDYH